MFFLRLNSPSYLPEVIKLQGAGWDRNLHAVAWPDVACVQNVCVCDHREIVFSFEAFCVISFQVALELGDSQLGDFGAAARCQCSPGFEV